MSPPFSETLEPTLEQRLREALAEFPAEDVLTIAAFAEFLWERRQAEGRPVTAEAELSEKSMTESSRRLMPGLRSQQK